MRNQIKIRTTRAGGGISNLLAVLLLLMPVNAHAQQHDRSVAFTIDDLPAVRSRDLEFMRTITDRLLSGLKTAQIPAIGFVNEVKLHVPGELTERSALLRAWLDSGFTLGNHTYGHLWFYETPLDVFKQDVIKGEKVTGTLLAGKGLPLRYFRHPRLNTGPDQERRALFEAFLQEREYTIAPVTIDNDEYVYALAYYNAWRDKETELMNRIGSDYVSYMSDIFGFYETFSRRIIGREPAQTLLIHANLLNADYLPHLVRMLRDRGYQFVSLDEALEDPAYSLPDTYTGRTGFSWLHRWAISMGKDHESQPGVPEWITKIAWP